MPGLGDVVPYGGYVLALVVLLWVSKQFLQKIIQEAATKVFGGPLERVFGGRLTARALRRYRNALLRNHRTHALGFVDTGTIEIEKVYVPLRYEAGGERRDVHERIRAEPRTVVLGGPGAGKSLLLKKHLLTWASQPRPSGPRVPVLIDLYRCNQSDARLETLVEQAFERNDVRNKAKYVDRALRLGELSVLFDGLDEVSRDDQARVVQALRDFAQRYDRCQVVVTCRTAVYHGLLSPDFDHVVHVADFDDADIRRFLGNWPGLSTTDVEQFSAELRQNPRLLRMATSPLLLTMIVYLRSEVFSKTGRTLPSSRAEFYDTAIVHLLRRDRDLVRHKSLSVYDADDKKAFLQRVALALQDAPFEQEDRRTIARRDALGAAKELLKDLDLDLSHADTMLTEIVDRSQLLVPVDRNRDRYVFRHLTLQEYLAALEIGGDADRLLRSYRADPDGWRETVKLWCGASGQDVTPVLSELFSSTSDDERLLAFEALAEARRVRDDFARDVIDHFLSELGESADDAALVATFAVVAGDSRPRGREVLRRLISTARFVDDRRAPTALAALSASKLPDAATFLGTMVDVHPEARAALRAMGEIAVPVLRTLAEAGSEDAATDLGRIGTPSAATVLSTLVWEDSPVAVRAAWWLATLTAEPGMLRALTRRAVPADVPVDVLNWVWDPLMTGIAAVDECMPRIAYLLSAAPGPVPDGISQIDARLALPLFLFGSSSVIEFRPFDSADSFRSSLLRSGRTDELPDATVERMWAAAVPPHGIRRRSHLIPIAVRRELLSSVAGTVSEKMFKSEWTSLQVRPKPAGLLSRRTRAATVTLGLAVLLGAGLRLFGGSVGVAQWGPGWLNTVGVWAFVAVVLVVVVLWKVGSSGVLGAVSESVLELLEDAWVVSVPVGAALVSVVIVLAGSVPAALLGWPGTIAAAVVVVGALLVAGLVLDRRRAALQNPLRCALALSGLLGADGPVRP